MIEHDDIYAKPQKTVPDFAFDEAVARVFPDMIRRSVPGYTTIIPMIEIITAEYAKANTLAYDLGCSLGASTLAMRHGLKNIANTRVISVDNSPAMIERCNHYIELDNAEVPVELRCADICDTHLENASVITLNFTLQFIPIAARVALLEKIHHALIPGGCLILSEKITFDSALEASTSERLHAQFKKANGYSDLEISQKRAAIENVLIADTLKTHCQRLTDAGFSHIQQWYQCFNFISMLAIK
jgi:tRNA (cmo5U34)-methyltransferase